MSPGPRSLDFLELLELLELLKSLKPNLPEGRIAGFYFFLESCSRQGFVVTFVKSGALA